VLCGLGLTRRLDPTPEALRTLYAAWCQCVPFDNVRKLIEMRADGESPMPGSNAADFFESWLKFGTGGTCWAVAGACRALLSSLGFDALRGVGTMLVVPDLPPNHGTVLVTFDGARYLVDCSILHGEPLRLEEDADTSVAHPAWGVHCIHRGGRWHVAWRPLHKVEGLECRLERFGAEQEEFTNFYEQTRLWSPFNYELSVRINRGDSVVGAAFGNAVSLPRRQKRESQADFS
jgi:N-hydroxyarylamine O-acetyltransferase